MQRASGLFRLLADGTRLRLLRVLAQDRFNVSELTGILGVAQSGVSRHLGLLKDAGLVTEEREGGYVYCRLADEGRTNGQGPLWALLDAQFAASASDRAVREDEARLQEVLRHRKENFETHGDVRQLVPGRSWAAWARALGHLLPPSTSLISGAVTATSRWKWRAGPGRWLASTDPSRCCCERRHWPVGAT